jgi:hypothetical protein
LSDFFSDQQFIDGDGNKAAGDGKRIARGDQSQLFCGTHAV